MIPVALRSGVGRPAIDGIRKLDKILVIFLEGRSRNQTVIDGTRAWFLACLRRHDSEDWLIDPVCDELEAYLAEICGESVGTVRADFDFIERHGAPGPNAPAPLTFDPPDPGPTSPRTSSPGAPIVHEEEASGAEIGDSARAAAAGRRHHEAGDFEEEAPNEKPVVRLSTPTMPGATNQPPRQSDLPQDVKSLRGRMWTLASQLAQRHAWGSAS